MSRDVKFAKLVFSFHTEGHDSYMHTIKFLEEIMDYAPHSYKISHEFEDTAVSIENASNSLSYIPIYARRVDPPSQRTTECYSYCTIYI